MPALDNLERFLHDEPTRIPPLLKAGIAHVQFETIHPFLDGNGRLGRLLITLLLCAEKVLSQPLLYLSLFLKGHRDEYYALLQRVRTDGDWEAWLEFYLTGVAEVAAQATDTAQKIVRLFDDDQRKIQKLGKAASSALQVHALLKRRAFTSIPAAVSVLELTSPSVAMALSRLEKLGIVRETTGRRRDRQFSYRTYLDILTADTR